MTDHQPAAMRCGRVLVALLALVLGASACSSDPGPSRSSASSTATGVVDTGHGLATVCGALDPKRAAAIEGVTVPLRVTVHTKRVDTAAYDVRSCLIQNASDDPTQRDSVSIRVDFMRPRTPAAGQALEALLVGQCTPAPAHGPHARTCPQARAQSVDQVYFKRDGVLLFITDMTSKGGGGPAPSDAYFKIANAYVAQPWTGPADS